MRVICVALSLFAILVATPVLLNWLRFCYNNFDLGIYSQALANISFADLNPWLSVRQIRIFNDHFDPVLVFFAPFARLIEPSLAAILIELAFVLATGFVLWRRSRVTAILMLFGPATVLPTRAV
ncbi:MAG: hypothetical protein ACK5QT_04395 [Oligoflexia bacterium]